METQGLVFVIDDDATIRTSVERYLQTLGFEVQAMSNGFDALLLCLYMKPELIISDVRMPKIDGITFLKALRGNEATAEIPVVFMTAFPKDDVIEKAKELGAKFFIIKPFPLEYLKQLVGKVLPHRIAETG